MSHIIMKYKVYGIDCVNTKCKNFQRLFSIEVFFYINTLDEVAIEYNFHSIDFDI